MWCRLASVALAGCAAAAPARPAVQAGAPAAPLPYAIAGEAMEFTVALRGIHVARVVLAVGDAGWIGGRRAIIVRSRGHSDGLLNVVSDLTWEATTTLALDDGLPITTREELWSKVRGKAHHELDQHDWSRRADRHDVHSLIGALRAWRAPRGKLRDVALRVVGDSLELQLWEAGRGEWIGKFPAVRYGGVRGNYRLTVWISDDADRVPLLFRAQTKWGDVTLRLVEYGSISGRQTIP